VTRVCAASSIEAPQLRVSRYDLDALPITDDDKAFAA
jgi:hypothetical protein